MRQGAGNLQCAPAHRASSLDLESAYLLVVIFYCSLSCPSMALSLCYIVSMCDIRLHLARVKGWLRVYARCHGGCALWP